MTWAIITIYISKCAQMNPQQLPKTSKFFPRRKKCEIKETLEEVGTTPLGRPKDTIIRNSVDESPVKFDVRVGY